MAEPSNGESLQGKEHKAIRMSPEVNGVGNGKSASERSGPGSVAFGGKENEEGAGEEVNAAGEGNGGPVEGKRKGSRQ